MAAAAPQVLEAPLAGAGAVLALHFGVSPEARGFQIELVGRNLRGARPDASGELPNSEAVIATGPAVLASTLPAERILHAPGARRLSRVAPRTTPATTCATR